MKDKIYFINHYDAMEACHFTPVLYWYCKLNCVLAALSYLILMRGVFVNLDCNLQTTEAKPATAE